MQPETSIDPWQGQPGAGLRGGSGGQGAGRRAGGQRGGPQPPGIAHILSGSSTLIMETFLWQKPPSLPRH